MTNSPQIKGIQRWKTIYNIMKINLSELTIIGLKYHYDTESWDRIHEHTLGPSGKSALPFDKSGSSANAYQARNKAMDSAVRMGFTPQEAIKAIQSTADYSFEEICRILDRPYFELNPVTK